MVLLATESIENIINKWERFEYHW